MWGNLNKITSNLLRHSEFIVLSKRSTFIFRRKNEHLLSTLEPSPPLKLKKKHFIYEVEDTEKNKSPLIDLVLLKDVPGIGMAGEKVTVNSYIGYRDLVVVGLGAYLGSEEAKNIQKPEAKIQYSSIHSKIVEKFLADKPLAIILSGKNKWTLEPQHVKLALRLEGLLVNEDCIKLPDEEITGPNLDLENKDFIVKLIMNKSEMFPIRCRICQGFTKHTDKHSNVLSLPGEPLFPRESEEIKRLQKCEAEIKKFEQIKAISVYKKRKQPKNHKYEKKREY